MTATVGEAVRQVEADFAAAGLAEPRRDAHVLVCHAIGADRGVITAHPERELSDAEQRRLDDWVTRRRVREPVARLLGFREFWSLAFRVTADTLIPRPDSETLVEAVLARVDRDRDLRVLDLGTGSGCLLLALLHDLPRATGLGVDRSAPAAKVARENARALGIGDRARFVVGDWASMIRGRFDVIVANPPYVRRGTIAELAPEVARFEPTLALDGGADGLDAYRVLLPGLSDVLEPEGVAAIEIGADQAAAIGALVGRDLGVEAIVPDLAGRDRCVVLGHAKKVLERFPRYSSLASETRD